MRIAVCAPQVPFARGGVEIFTDELVEELRARGHEADLLSIPFKWYPGERVLTQAFLWRLLDLEEADGRRIDLVVATKFPSYVVRHPRSASGSSTSSGRRTSSTAPSSASSAPSPEDRALRRRVQELDRSALGEATRLFATSRERRRAGSSARPGSSRRCFRTRRSGCRTGARRARGSSSPASRLDRAKRIDLLLEAAAARPVARTP